MLSLIAQWLDEHFNIKKVLLDAQECSGSHTGTMICQTFETMFELWSLTNHRVHVVLRDNARNMTKVMEECRLVSLGCMARTLQLAINEAVLSQKSITDCVSICRKMVGHFNTPNLPPPALKTCKNNWAWKTQGFNKMCPWDKTAQSTCWEVCWSKGEPLQLMQQIFNHLLFWAYTNAH